MDVDRTDAISPDLMDGTELILSSDDEAPAGGSSAIPTPDPSSVRPVKQELSLNDEAESRAKDSGSQFPGSYETSEIMRRARPAPLNGPPEEDEPMDDVPEGDVTVSPTELLPGIGMEEMEPDLPTTSAETVAEPVEEELSFEQPSMEECSPVMSSDTNQVMTLALEDAEEEAQTGKKRKTPEDDEEEEAEEDAGSGSPKSYITNDGANEEADRQEESNETMEAMLKSIGLESRKDDLTQGNDRREERDHSVEIEAPPMRPARASPAGSGSTTLTARSGTPSSSSGVIPLSRGTARRTGGAPKPGAASTTSRSLLRRCIVSSCRNYNKPSEHVFPFPDPERRAPERNKWIRMINDSAVRNRTVTSSYLLHDETAGVCKEHFREADTSQEGGACVLKKGVLPVRFEARPGYEGPVPGKSQFAKKSVGAVEHTTVARCAQPGCKNTKPGHVHIPPPLVIARPPADPNRRLPNIPVRPGLNSVRNRKKPPVPPARKAAPPPRADRPKRAAATRPAVQITRELSDDDADYDADMDIGQDEPEAVMPPSSQAPLKIVLQKLQPPPPVVPTAPRRLPPPVQAAAPAMEVDEDDEEEEDASQPRPPLKIILQKMVPVSQKLQERGKVSLITRATQVHDEELDADSDEEEVEAIIREAHEELLDLRMKVEDAESALVTEKYKVAHLEARVAAWMREHFQCQAQETERVEMYDKLANYYLQRAKKVEEDKKAVSAEVELFRANYVRAQKETESYRAQIIELQTTSARQVELVVQTKTKNEKEAMETIASLRRQLAESVSANQTARKTYVNLLTQLGIPVPEEISALADAGTANSRTPARPVTRTRATPAAKKKAAESAAAALLTPTTSGTSPAKTAPPPSQPAPVTPVQTPASPAGFNPRQTRQRQREQEAQKTVEKPAAAPVVQQPTAGYAVHPPPSGGWNGYGFQPSVIQPTPGTSAFSQPTYQPPPEVSPPRKRGRPRREDPEVNVPTPKKPRESSVDRAVRYLMSL